MQFCFLRPLKTIFPSKLTAYSIDQLCSHFQWCFNCLPPVSYEFTKRLCYHHLETNQFICSPNEFISFYTVATLAFNRLKFSHWSCQPSTYFYWWRRYVKRFFILKYTILNRGNSSTVLTTPSLSFVEIV